MKKSRHYEVVEKTPMGEKRLGIVRASSHSKAVNKLAKQRDLPERVTSYPVKLKKKKPLGPAIALKTDKSFAIPRSKKRRYDYIGNVKVDAIEGVYGKRSETIYGKRTAGLAGKDIRKTLSDWKKRSKTKLM